MSGLPNEGRIDPVKAAVEDASALSNLAKRAYAYYVPVIKAIPVPMSADYAAHIRDNDVWVIREKDHAKASIVLIHEPTCLLIESIAVDPDYQGHGLGKALLNFAKDYANANGYPEIRLYTNVLMKDNRHWYAREGFVETGEEQRGDKRIVHMRLRLADTRSA